MTAEAVAAPDDLSPWRRAGLEQRGRRRRLLLAELVLFVVVTVFFGFPTGREVITFWMLLTLLAACAGDVRVWRRAVVRDWLPLLAVLFAYDLLRGLANETGGALFGLPRWQTAATGGSVVRANLEPPLNGDKLLFGGTVPTTWLQERFYDPGTAHWYDAVAAVVYMSHFLVSLGVAITLWCVSYPLFRRYLVALVTLTMAALATYVLYPAVPPWMASLNPDPSNPGQTFLPYVQRVVPQTLDALGSQTVSSFVEQGAAYSNPVAAMPSLHAAIPMMLLLFFWPLQRTRGRLFLVGYALAMALTLVYTGEHYVTDVLAGWLYAAVVVGVLGVLRRRGPRTGAAP